MMSKKIQKLVALIILVNLAYANFVFAQTPQPAPTTATPAITKADLDNAKDEAGCKKLRTLVQTVSSGQAKAIWQKPVIGNGYASDAVAGSCGIVPGTYHDDNDLYGDLSSRPTQYTQLEDRIRNGTGITQADWTQAQAQYIQQQNQAGPVNAAIGSALGFIFDVLANFLGLIAAGAGKIFAIVVDNVINVTQMPIVVTVGWTVVRDFCNMFFILILIVIAIAAILRIESYDYRHLLGEVVIMALLVNFSMVIAVSLMNLTNVVVAILAPTGFQDVFSHILSIVNWHELTSFTVGSGDALIQGFTKVTYMAVLTVSFIALAGMFVIRLVGLYVLIILSPVAYALDILPATKNLAHEWWHSFVHYLVWAPVSLFFIRLAILVADNSAAMGLKQGNDSAFKFIILIALIWAAVIVAEHAGMKGGDAVVHAAEHGLHSMGHTVQHAVSGRAGRMWNDYTSHMYAKNPESTTRKVAFTILNPVAAGKAWSERAHEQDHISSGYALATGKEIFGGKVSTPYRAFLARKEEMEFSKEYALMSREGRMDAALKLQGLKGHEAAVRRRALMRAAAEENEVEDVALHFVEKNVQVDDGHGHVESAERRYLNPQGEFGNHEMGQFMRDYLESGHDTESKRFIEEDWSNIGKKTRRFDYAGHSGTAANDAAQADEQVASFGKLDGQVRAQVSPQNFSTFKVTKDAAGNVVRVNGKIEGNYVYNNTQLGARMINLFDQDARSQINRSQARMTNALVTGQVNTVNNSVQVNNRQDFDRLRALFTDNKDTARLFFAKKLRVNKPADWANDNNNQARIELIDPATGTSVDNFVS